MTTFRKNDDVVSKIDITSIYITIKPGDRGKVVSVRDTSAFPLLVQFNGENLLMRYEEVGHASHKDNRDPLDLSLDEWYRVLYAIDVNAESQDDALRGKIADYLKEHE